MLTEPAGTKAAPARQWLGVSGSAWRRGRAPDHEPYRQARDAPRGAGLGEQREQQARRLRAQLLVRGADGGERRVERVREAHVVVADDRDVPGAIQAALGQRAKYAERDQVVPGHDRGGLRVLVEDP